MKATAHRGTTGKHAGSRKSAGTAKHHPSKSRASGKAHKPKSTAVAKHPTHAKARGLAVTFGDAACCAAEALGASLRLAGWPVGQEDVLALHEAAGGSLDAGVTILAAILAARRHGLAGVRPLAYGPVAATDRAGQILGLELPGPHYVTAAGDGCWISWGEHYDPAEFPAAVVEEAWAVTWP